MSPAVPKARMKMVGEIVELLKPLHYEPNELSRVLDAAAAILGASPLSDREALCPACRTEVENIEQSTHGRAAAQGFTLCGLRCSADLRVADERGAEVNCGTCVAMRAATPRPAEVAR